MTTPAWLMQIAPGVAPGTVVSGGAWVTITDDVEEVHTDTGRKDEWSGFAAGTMQVQLDNHLGTYDPEFTLGPYYGHLVQFTPVRFLAGETTADEDAFYGFVSIDGWRVLPNHPADSTGVITVVDFFDLLAATDLPSSAYAVEVAVDAPTHWWRMNDSAGSTVARDSGSSPVDGSFASPAVLGSTHLAKNETTSGLSFTASPSQLSVPFSVDVTLAADFLLTLAYDWDPTAGSLNPLYARDAVSGDTWYVSAGNDATGPYLRLVVTGAAGTAFSSKLRPGADAPSGLISVQRAGNTWTLTYTSAASTLTASFVQAFGGITRLSILARTASEWVAAGTGTVSASDLALWVGTVPSSPRMVVQAEAFLTAWAGDLPGPRLSRIAAAAGIASALTDFDDGQSRLQGATLGGNVLAAMQLVALSERGRLFVHHRDGGKLRFIGRTALAGPTVATFGDSGAEIPYAGLTLNDDRIINRAGATPAGGRQATAQDPASIGGYGVRSLSESGLLFSSPTEALSRVEFIVSIHKDRRRRCAEVVLEPRKSTHAAWPVIFDVDIGQRVDVVWRPAYGGTQTYECVVEGIRHELSCKEGAAAWRTVLALSPAGRNDLGVWGVSTWDGGVWAY
jgi:hypothetical protein